MVTAILSLELIAEWVRRGTGARPQMPRFACAEVARYLKHMTAGRICLERLLAAQTGATLKVPGVQAIPSDLDWRLGDVAIVASEVIIIRVEPAGTKLGKFYPAHEIYPSSGQWGQYGWTYTWNSHTDPESALIARTIAAADRRRREAAA